MLFTSFFGRTIQHVQSVPLCCPVLSRSLMSDSLRPLWTIAPQAPLSMGILQARILEWVAMPSSLSSSTRDQTCALCSGIEES